MIEFFKNRVIGSDRGISIILAIIVIIMLGLAGSVFAYLMASGSITSRSDLLSAEAKYAAKSGVEMTLYELEQKQNGNGNGKLFSVTALQGCPTTSVLPPGVSGTAPVQGFFSGNLAGNLPTGSSPNSVNYTPTFCAVEGKLTPQPTGNCTPTYYVITSNGFAGGTEREVAAEVGIKNGTGNNCTGIYVEAELPNN
ncbi:MAG: hypothetical protein ACYCTD_05765 [bacterium]